MIRKIRAISEAEIIAVSFQAEFRSSRFRQAIAAHLQKEDHEESKLSIYDVCHG